MCKPKAFTLLEMLISIGFTTIIIFSIIRVLRHASVLASNSSLRTEVDRRAEDILNQLEKDLSCASVMNLQKIIKPKIKTSESEKEESKDKTKENENKDKDNDKEKDKKKESESEKLEEKKENEEKEEEEKGPSKLFLASTQETTEVIRKGTKRFQLFQNLNFITTNNLSEINQQEIKPVRVQYSLMYDKDKSKGGKASYKLVRKETTNLENTKFLNQADMFDKNKNVIKEYLIADYIKALYIEYFMKKQEKEEDKEKITLEKPIQEIRSFIWGDKPDTKNILPFYATIKLELWDGEKSKSYEFNNRVIFWTYKTKGEYPKKKVAEKPTQKPSEEKAPQNKEEKQKTENESKEEPKTTTNI